MAKKIKKEILVNFKVNEPEYRELLKRAKRFSKGNLSFWLRYAGMSHTPSKKELK